MSPIRFYLASASPRRRQLLELVGIHAVVVQTDIDERALPGETPVELVRRLACAKGRSAELRLAGAGDAVVLAADTEVVVDGTVLGKPAGAREGAEMLRRLSGRMHEVLTGVYLSRPGTGGSLVSVDSTRVSFRNLDEATIAAYVATGEGVDKAGGYAMQGRGVLLTRGIEGSWSNVVGLPLERLPEWLAAVGVTLADLG